MIKPVYFFSGMLDSGKTRAIKTTLYDERFNEPGEFNLIISMEQAMVKLLALVCRKVILGMIMLKQRPMLIKPLWMQLLIS